MKRKIQRGDLYYIDLENIRAFGSEQIGIRPGVVIQNNVGNEHSPTVIIAPISSKAKEKAKLPTHVFLKGNPKRLVKDSIILVEQMRVIDRIRLKYFQGTLTENEIKAMDEAILIALGIDIDKAKKQMKDIIDKEEKTEFITRKQVASYAIVAKEHLKQEGNDDIDNEVFERYILTLMDMIPLKEIEEEAEIFKRK